MLRVVDHFADSDVGRQRHGNEDALFVRAPLFVVADGMGGAQAGEVASQMAVGAFADGLEGAAPAEELVRIVREANRRIHERSLRDRQTAGMGTTLTAACLTTGDEVVVAHVGDSRCYLLRDGDFIRLTRDHSLVGELVARGKLTEEQAETHPQRSVITRALGSEPDVEVDIDVYAARSGDLFLLCSDGLTSMVTEPRIKEMLEGPGDLDAHGRELIAAANRAGGRDNITVILFRLGEVGRAPASATAPAGEDTAVAAGATSAMPAVPAPGGQETTAIEVVGTPGTAGERDDPPPVAAAADAQPRASEVPTTESHRAGDAAALSGGAAVAGASRAASERRDDRRRRPRGRHLGRLLGVLAAILVFLVIPFWLASRLVYFVGVDAERGRVVTIYRGVPYELPGGVDLYERFYPSGVTIDAVPAERREIFTNHELRSRDDAEDLVIALERGELNR